MPVLMSFFLFACLSSLALPLLNGFVGEFLILIGVFEKHHAWASWAASGAVLSAIYLLWAYQRVALGEVTIEKNRALPDASPRERIILGTMAVVILFMGVASPLFTRRMEPATNVLLEQMKGRAQDAKQPAIRPALIAPKDVPPLLVPTLAAVPPASALAVKSSANRVRP
jgi:NADH-quinone oxidoreductase subunit M